MNKVITINLAGIAYQLEEAGYEALREYLGEASRRLTANPDREEILADIEAAIGEKFRVLLGGHKNVVLQREVASVLEQMGGVEDASEGKGGAPAGGSSAGEAARGEGAGKSGGAAREAQSKPRARRLYRLNEGAMLFGVCSGLQAFTGIPVIAWRMLFVFMSVPLFGLTVLVYLAMVAIVPLADSPEEREQAEGPIPTVEDFVRRAREGYYRSAKGFSNSQERREWSDRLERDMRAWGQRFGRQFEDGWRHAWQRSEGRRRAAAPGLLLGACLLSILAAFVCVVLLGCLMTGGSFLGFTLPFGATWWVTMIIVLVVMQFLFWPFAWATWLSGGRCRRHGGGGLGLLLVLSAAAFGLCWWLYPEQARALAAKIPPALHQLAELVQGWLQ